MKILCPSPQEGVTEKAKAKKARDEDKDMMLHDALDIIKKKPKGRTEECF